MPLLHVERTGGLANYGGARAHVRSRGHVESDALSAADQQTVEALFRRGNQAASLPMTDGFHYKISRTTPTGPEAIEAPESAIPAALLQCVKDEFV